jgi:ADP-dependent NAD(P)H-hydrate dehydratase / NAD(P)H-hydrate epimerase
MGLPVYQKQTQQPLFADILWNRPINRAAAGTLLIVGGHSRDFSLVQSFYQTAIASGIGRCRVILPDSLRSLLAGTPDTVFVPGNASGALAREALGLIVQMAEEAQAVAIGVNLSSSSETTVLVEALLEKLTIPIILHDEGLNVIKHHPQVATSRADCLIIANMQQVFKLSGWLGLPIAIRTEGGVVNKVEIMAELAQAGRCNYLLSGRDMITAAENQISLTATVSAMDFFQSATYGAASVFWAQNRQRPFAGLTTAAYVLAQARARLSADDRQPLLTAEITAAIKSVLKQES